MKNDPYRPGRANQLNELIFVYNLIYYYIIIAGVIIKLVIIIPTMI